MLDNGSFLMKMFLNTCLGAKNGSLGQGAFVGTYIKLLLLDSV